MNLFYFYLAAIQFACAAQTQLQAPTAQAPAPASASLKSPVREEERWRFDLEPSPNATGNYVFETVASLLQQWPNTRYRNGHNIVPAMIPVGTLLHYGSWENRIPTGPDWVATDPEHSYLFCVGVPETPGCWHLTLAVTRPLNVLYFDGSGAAKLAGALDTQDILIWGKVEPERMWDEYHRIADLCQWGKQYNIDGYLRMEVDFEIMLCDFTEGVEIVSFLNLVPARPRGRRSPTAEGLLTLPQHRSIEAGQWHNRFPGETRAQLDLSRLISFYDTDMFPSLMESRDGKERWDHRVETLGAKDRQTLLHKLDQVMGGSSPKQGSGVDWSSLVHVIVQRYANRLEVLQYLLNSTRPDSASDRSATIRVVHEYITSMLNPYIPNDLRPINSNSTSATLAWAVPVFQECATTHTRILSTSLRPLLTQSEALILSAIETVSHEICRVVVGVWADGVVLGLDVGSNAVEAEPARGTAVEWSSRINSLIRWLDWSVWVKCNPACGFEETCYLPTWPWLNVNNVWETPRNARPVPRQTSGGDPHMKWDRVERRVRDMGSDQGRFADDTSWDRPHPKCIRRVQK